MALDAATLNGIRRWVGSTPDDATIEATFNIDGIGTVEDCALSILQTRLADLEGTPATFDVKSDYSQSTGKNLDSLRDRISQLESLVGCGDSVVSVGRLARCTGR